MKANGGRDRGLAHRAGRLELRQLTDGACVVQTAAFD